MKKCDPQKRRPSPKSRHETPPIFDPTSKALYCGDSKVGWFYIDLYATNVYVMWPAGHDDVLRFMDETFPQIDRSAMSDHNGWNGKTLQILDNSGSDAGYLIALKQWDGTPKCHATLTHEALHVACMVLSLRGFRLTPETEEVYTYLTDAIVRNLLEVITRFY